MSTLRISDAPLLPDVDGAEKIPTGGRGDYAVSIDQIKEYTRGGLPQELEDHINDTSNPHQVNKDQVGLGNVDNTSDVDKPISTATQEALDLKANQSTTYTRTEVDGSLGLKADKTYVDSQDLLKADKTYVDDALAGFSNGASKFYPTLAAANADIANIAVNDKVEVGEVVNGGIWYKATAEATTLTKSAYDPLIQAKVYADSNGLFKPIQFTSTVWTHADQLKTKGWYRVPSTTVATNMGLPNPAAGFLLVVSNYEFGGNSVKQEWFPQLSSKMFLRASDVNGIYPAWGEVLTTSNKELEFREFAKKKEVLVLSEKPYETAEISKNLFDQNLIIVDSYLNNSGIVADAVGWGRTDYIPVTGGETYTISAESKGRHGLAFFASNEDVNPILGSYNDSTSLPLTVTAPATANYLVVNLYSSTIPAFNKVQVEKGSAATPYVLGGTSYSLKPEYVLPAATKPYDIVTASKNLFISTNVVQDSYLNNTGVIATATGWKRTGYIPVTGGETYTISAKSKGRQGLAFFVSNEAANPIAGSYDGSTTLPITVTAPIDAQYLIVNLESPTAQGYSEVQIEEGSIATPYSDGGVNYKIDPAYIAGSADTKNKLKISGLTAELTGVIEDLDIKLQVLLGREKSHSLANVFNFYEDFINNIRVRNTKDDVAPMRMDNYTVGANHGYLKSDVTLTAHGKTVLDIGSVWNDSVREYVIVDIVSNNILSVVSRVGSFSFQVGRTLTHVSGASNTSAFTPTAKLDGQWYPSIRDRKISCFVDGSKIDLSKDATHQFSENVSFLESYSIMKREDMVEWVIANSGSNQLDYEAAPTYTVSFGYSFDKELGCTIYFGGVGRKTVDLADQMITQSLQMDNTGGVVYNYIPKAVEFTDGGFTYNFSQLENLSVKNPSTPLFINAAKQEVGTNPIDRIIMLNDQVGYATGYLPVLDAAPDVRVTNASRKYLEIRNGSLKLYPRLIDSASITQINEGDAFAAIAYRKYFKRSTERTSKYVVRSEMGDYLYLDWHSVKTDEIELAADLVGREFEVVEKSSNVTLLSKFASNSILVKIDATKNYGYLVIKFK